MKLDLGYYMPSHLIPEIIERVMISKSLNNKYELAVISPNIFENQVFGIMARPADLNLFNRELVRRDGYERIILQPIKINQNNSLRFIHLEVSNNYDWYSPLNTRSEPDESYDEKLKKDFSLMAERIQELSIEKLDDLKNELRVTRH